MITRWAAFLVPQESVLQRLLMREIDMFIADNKFQDDLNTDWSNDENLENMDQLVALNRRELTLT